MAWAGEGRSSYRKYGQALRRTHDAKDPGPSGCVAAGPRGVAALDRIADTLVARLLADRLAATQRSRFNLVKTWSRLAAIALLLGSPAFAQSYGIGRTPTQDEIRALDISIGPTGEELPVGHGTAKEGAVLFQQKGCAGCHGKAGVGAMAPQLQSNKGQDLPLWERGRGSSGWMILPLTAPYATIVWDYIHRGMPLGKEGSLKPDEVYALTAYLLFVNKVIPEDLVLDKESLPKVKMPIGDDYGRLPDWKHGTPRLPGYNH